MLNYSPSKSLLFLGATLSVALGSCQQGSPAEIEDPNITRQSSSSELTLGLHSDQLTTVALGPKIALSASLDYSVRAWDMKNGQLLWTINTLSQPVTALAMDSLSRSAILGMADGQVSLWSMETRTKIQDFPGLDRGITSVAISPNGQWIAAGDFGGSLNVWESHSGQMIFRSQIHSKALNELQFSPNNRFLASASDDNTGAVWEVKRNQTGAPLWPLQEHHGWVTSLAFSPNTQWVATASADHFIRIWSLKTGKLLRKFYGHKATLSKIHALDDQRLAAVGGNLPPNGVGPENRDYSVTLFNIKTGNPEFQSSGHSGPVFDIKTDPFGSLVTASIDESIKSWGPFTK